MHLHLLLGTFIGSDMRRLYLAFQEMVVAPSPWILLPSYPPFLISSPLFFQLKNKACHDIAIASQDGGQGLWNLPYHPWHCLSHLATLHVSLLNYFRNPISFHYQFEIHSSRMIPPWPRNYDPCPNPKSNVIHYNRK